MNKKYIFEKNKVVETLTGYVIKACKSKEDAKKLASQLNGGKGFQGETPRFFIKASEQNAEV